MNNRFTRILPILILPIGQALFTLYVREQLIRSGRPVSMLLVISEVLMLLFTGFWIYWISGRERWEQVRRELEDRRQAKEMEELHYREVKAKREELQVICKGYEGQLEDILELIHTRKTAQAEEQIDRLSDAILATRETPYCSIPVVNAVLMEKAKLCAEQGIELQTDLRIPRTEVEDLQLCSLFGNLLDNAIRGVVEWKKMQKGSEGAEARIRLTAAVRDGYLVIRTENPSPVPAKKTRPGHGYGTKIMQTIAESLGGSYVSEYSDGIYLAAVTCRAGGNDGNRDL